MDQPKVSVPLKMVAPLPLSVTRPEAFRVVDDAKVTAPKFVLLIVVAAEAR